MSYAIESSVDKDYWLAEEAKIALKLLLKQAVIEVVFKKADGDSRSMNCTLAKHKLPDYEDQKESTRKPNPDVCVVFDVDKQEWRSFRWDRILQVSIPPMLIATE